MTDTGAVELIKAMIRSARHDIEVYKAIQDGLKHVSKANRQIYRDYARTARNWLKWLYTELDLETWPDDL